MVGAILMLVASFQSFGCLLVGVEICLSVVQKYVQFLSWKSINNIF